MAGVIGKYAAKKMLGKHMDKYKDKKVAGDDDPFFTEVPGRNGKMRKVKKQIPDFIPEHDAQVLASVKASAYKLDMSLFNLGGIRFGWSSVIGIIPELGDVIDMLMAVRIYKKCQKVEGGLPSSIANRMMLNIILDFLVGLIPILGDLADAAFRCNTKNVLLLEKHLKKKYGPNDAKLQRMSGIEFFDEDQDANHVGTAQPLRSQQPDELNETSNADRLGNKKKGWFGGPTEPRHDIEMGRGRA